MKRKTDKEKGLLAQPFAFFNFAKFIRFATDGDHAYRGKR